MKYKCKKSFCVDRYDEDGFLIENSSIVIDEGKAYELDELKQMIFEGKIQDSKTMAAILAYESKYLHG